MPQGHPGFAEDRLFGRLIEAQLVGEKPQVLRVRRGLLAQVFAPQLTREIATPHAAFWTKRLDNFAAGLVKILEWILIGRARREERQLGIDVRVYRQPPSRRQCHVQGPYRTSL